MKILTKKATMNKLKDPWNSGDPYEYYMGRWSKLMAPEFLKWLNLPSSLSWLDIGCGTGALSEAIFKFNTPSHLTSIDPSEGFLNKADSRLQYKGDFRIGNATKIPLQNNSVEVVVSGLALNFFEDLDGALSEMKRVSKTNGVIAAYVWDYSGRIDLIRYFWDAAVNLYPDSKNLDEGIRFPICNKDKLKNSFINAGLSEVQVTNLDIITCFKNFEDYCHPFLGRQGPAPGYLASLSRNHQEKLRNEIYKKLPFERDGSIKLLGRAIAVKGKIK